MRWQKEPPMNRIHAHHTLHSLQWIFLYSIPDIQQCELERNIHRRLIFDVVFSVFLFIPFFVFFLFGFINWIEFQPSWLSLNDRKTHFSQNVVSSANTVWKKELKYLDVNSMEVRAIYLIKFVIFHLPHEYLIDARTDTKKNCILMRFGHGQKLRIITQTQIYVQNYSSIFSLLAIRSSGENVYGGYSHRPHMVFWLDIKF